MSTVDRKTSRGERGQSPRSLFRWIAAGSIATILMTGAYQASWGQGAGGNHNPQPPGGDNGLSSGEVAAIVVGGLAVGGGLFWLLAGRRRKKHHDEDQQKAVTLPEGRKVSELKLVPSSRSVDAGDVDVFELKGLAEDGKWYSVTSRDGASIEVKNEGSALVRQDGAKNAFCLPITTSSEYNGKTVTLVGHFDTLSAETSVTLNVGGELATAQ